MKRSVSIEDIARTAGVSHSTVSRALRDSPLISVEVRERVQALAREMGYVPNAIAQSLKQQQTNTIGLIVTSIADPFYPDAIKGIEETAQAAGKSVFISATYNDEDLEHAIIDTFHRRKVDGVIIISSRLTQNYQHLRRLGVPAVLVNYEARFTDQVLHSVMVDDRSGTLMAMRHLIELGHRHIGYLGIVNRPLSNELRCAGYHEALRAAGLPADPASLLIVDSPGPDTDDVLAAAQAMRQMLRTRVTAVFCYNDMVAIGALRTCNEQRIAVPRQMSIVGFDDIAMAQYVTPALTTVRQPRRELGSRAMQKLLRLMDGESVEDEVLTPQLIVRDSTAGPRARR